MAWNSCGGLFRDYETQPFSLLETNGLYIRLNYETL